MLENLAPKADLFKGVAATWPLVQAGLRSAREAADMLVAAQSQKPVQLQTMRREMGGGKFVMMKTAGAPVWVRGRHWGAVSIAYILP